MPPVIKGIYWERIHQRERSKTNIITALYPSILPDLRLDRLKGRIFRANVKKIGNDAFPKERKNLIVELTDGTFLSFPESPSGTHGIRLIF